MFEHAGRAEARDLGPSGNCRVSRGRPGGCGPQATRPQIGRLAPSPRTGAAHQLQRRKINDVLIPPNAKLLLITTSVSMTRPLPVM